MCLHCPVGTACRRNALSTREMYGAPVHRLRPGSPARLTLPIRRSKSWATTPICRTPVTEGDTESQALRVTRRLPAAAAVVSPHGVRDRPSCSLPREGHAVSLECCRSPPCGAYPISVLREAATRASRKSVRGGLQSLDKVVPQLHCG
ncbi:hypothetical protein [Rhodococcus tibetensis]|uniref:hypothetical protein n=1 Tax=Rhodococcus tibetensis TaxID=2965064 RepID=UPI0035AC1BBC